MTRERLLDKIKKLLELGKRSPYQEEAETAMALVQQMLLKHNLSMGEVESFKPSDDFGDESVWEGKRRPWEHDFVEMVVSEFFFVKIHYLIERDGNSRKRSTFFFGEQHNIAVARYVFVYLCRVFRQLWADYRRTRGLTKKYAREFYGGLQFGLHCKLSQQRRKTWEASDSARNALILVGRQLTRRFDERHGDLRPAKQSPIQTSNHRVASDGFEAGRRIEIRKGVASDPKTTAALTHE